jgi:hypothetical protein
LIEQLHEPLLGDTRELVTTILHNRRLHPCCITAEPLDHLLDNDFELVFRHFPFAVFVQRIQLGLHVIDGNRLPPEQQKEREQLGQQASAATNKAEQLTLV